VEPASDSALIGPRSGRVAGRHQRAAPHRPLAEAYHVPVSPHNAMGPLQVLADAHTMMTVPNLYRLEHNIANYGNAFIDHPVDFQGDQLFLSDRPGLGVDFDVEKLEAHLVYRRPGM
jgi:galactonate dehydratase